MTPASERAPRHGGTLWALPLDGTAPPAVQPRVAAQFQCVAVEEAPALAQAMGLADPAPVLARFASGGRCYAASVAGRDARATNRSENAETRFPQAALPEGALAAYGWVSFEGEEIGELGLRLHLAPGEAYIWDCATLPAYRGQRLYPALLSHMIGELRAGGLWRIWIGASHDNLPSQQGMALAGFQPVVDIFTSSINSGQMWAEGRPGAPDALVRDARQALFGEHE